MVLKVADRWFERSRIFDQIPGADVGAYLSTRERLGELPVSVMHRGHDDSMSRDRFRTIVDGYIATRSP